MARIYEDITRTVGNTPLVRLNSISKGCVADIVAKLESFNPLSSVKDRIGVAMIEDAQRKGLLKKNSVIVEPTSGNTGIALAAIAAIKGYKIEIVMPESMSIERRTILKALGAKLILTPAEDGTDGAIAKAREMARNPKHVLLDQFKNPANVKAHYETTGKEVLEQTKGKVTHFVAGLGTTGTLMGVSKRLKEYNKEIKIVGVEPHASSKIPGLKNLNENIVPEIFDASKLDRVVRIKDRDAFRTTTELAKKEGLLVGISSGAAMYVAMQTAKKLKGGVIVALFPDGGEKYLNMNLFK